MIELRRATPSDVDDLVRLHLDTVSVAYSDFFPADAVRPSPGLLRPLWQHDLDEGHGVFVAVDGGAVVGSVVARRAGELARLHVHPTRWREGIGRELHDAAVDLLRAAGHAELGLWVIDANAAARTLYEHAGWTLVPGKELVELGVTEVRYARRL